MWVECDHEGKVYTQSKQTVPEVGHETRVLVF